VNAAAAAIDPSTTPPRARAWSETLPLEIVGSSRVLALLRRFGVAVDVAVRPWDLGALADLAARCDGGGVALGVWPMLDDRDGRWASVRNAPPFRDLALRALDACGPRAPSRLAVDLEPSFVAMDRVLARFVAPSPRARGGDGAGLGGEAAGARPARRGSPPGFGAGRAALRGLVAEARARGVVPAAAVLPPVLFGAPWERALGTPIRGVGFEAVSAMAYTSIVEGWSRGIVSRRRAVRLLAWTCARAASALGARAAVSLGAVGAGAFGAEPTYRGPRELAEDAAVARAAGLRELSLLDLGGVLAREPAEAWLAALVEG